MGKRDFDKQRHTAKKYMLGKSGKSGKGGWGDALDDYRQGWDAKEEYEYYEQDDEKEEEAVEDQEPVSPLIPPQAAGAEVPPVAKALSDWSVEEVQLWVTGLGKNFGTEAAAFADSEIDGEMLFDLTYDDLEGTLGKGLKTKKLWTQLTKLVNKARTIINDLTIPQQWFWYCHQSGWKPFPKKQNWDCEQAYQARQEMDMRGWTILMQRKQPYAVRNHVVRLLKRAGPGQRVA